MLLLHIMLISVVYIHACKPYQVVSCKIVAESTHSLFICLLAKLFIPKYHLTSDMVNITCLNLVDKELERAQSIIITTEACASLATIADLCAWGRWWLWSKRDHEWLTFWKELTFGIIKDSSPYVLYCFWDKNWIGSQLIRINEKAFMRDD